MEKLEHLLTVIGIMLKDKEEAEDNGDFELANKHYKEALDYLKGWIKTIGFI